ncbi:MAG: hypothetical protein ACOYK9_05830 [Chlamydiia bacterium]
MSIIENTKNFITLEERFPTLGAFFMGGSLLYGITATADLLNCTLNQKNCLNSLIRSISALFAFTFGAEHAADKINNYNFFSRKFALIATTTSTLITIIGTAALFAKRDIVGIPLTILGVAGVFGSPFFALSSDEK